MSAVKPEIFKAYDVRGLYGEDMDGETAYLVGRGFARVLSDLREKPTSELRVGLGRDMRLQAPEMAGRLADGLVAEGCEVLDAGMVGTEMLYFLVGSRELDGGAMVTASHNPKAYTGVKLVREGALALSGDAGIQDIRRKIEAGLPDAPGGGSISDVDIYPDFQAHAMSFIDPERVKPLKVVLDGGNGMAGPMAGPLLDRLPIETIKTYWKPDGNFPDHEPNPLLPENRQFVIDRVLSEGADLGIAWDGDADRCFFIDDEGEFVDGDFLTALLAKQVLAQGAGRDDPLRRSRLARGAGHRRRARRNAPRSTAWVTPSSRSRCASTAAPSAAKSPATTTSTTSTRRTRARSRRSSSSSSFRSRAGRSRSWSATFARATSSRARSTRRSRTPKPR